MNKKYVAGGVLLLVLLAGYAGMHVLEKNIAQHEELVQALRLKDFPLAVTLETEHLSKLKYEADGIIEAHPEYFSNRKADV